jgi:long-chain acyl-CoA synthetase
MTTRYRDAVTTEPPRAGEQTMATLAKLAADRYGETTAARFLRDGEWQQLTYNELWDRVRDLALGFARLGVGVGDRVAILANTCVEFTIADLAASSAGAVVVPVYPSNSPEECEWVVGDSGSKVIVCEDPEQVAKIGLVRDNLPALEHIVVIDGQAEGVPTMEEVAATGRSNDPVELDERAGQVAADDACLIIYTSGTTGRPKGVVLTNRGFAAARRTGVEIDLLGPGALVYLYLPLAHVFAQLVQAMAFEIGAPLAFWGGDPTRIVAELGEVKPDVLPSVPRIFEKVYAAAMAMIPADGHAEVAAAIELGNRVRDARLAGDAISAEDAAEFDRVDNELFPLVRGIFGGNIGLAISGAAPIAPEILRFFYACGVPVMEGWGMTETTGIGTVNLPEAHRFGTIGRAVGAADIRVADDGEIEIAGDFLLREYWNNPEATNDVFTTDGYLRTGDLGSIDDDGYVTITGRKKDIIITAGGKNLTPANLEGDLRRSQWISQVVMYGDRKPYPVAIVTLDAEVVVPWAEANGLPADLASLARHEQVVAMIQEELDAVNSRYARVEQIKRFKVLDRDFTIDSGELTPSLKLKRNVVYVNLAEEFERLYS